MNKIKNKKKNQRSFYFNEYNQKFNSEKNDGANISQDRIYLLFFIFFCLIFIFATILIRSRINHNRKLEDALEAYGIIPERLAVSPESRGLNLPSAPEIVQFPDEKIR